MVRVYPGSVRGYPGSVKVNPDTVRIYPDSVSVNLDVSDDFLVPLSIFLKMVIFLQKLMIIVPESMIIYPESMTVYPESMIVYPESKDVNPEAKVDFLRYFVLIFIYIQICSFDNIVLRKDENGGWDKEIWRIDSRKDAKTQKEWYADDADFYDPDTPDLSRYCVSGQVHVRDRYVYGTG